MKRNDLLDRTKHIYRNKYYNLFKSNFKWGGITYRQEEYVMRKFWADGTVAAFKLKGIDELGFAPWAQFEHDMYGLPERVTLVNEFSSPLVPVKLQTVDKDVVIGYIQSNKKPLRDVVEYYIERMAEVDCVINTNLQLQKMPFVLHIDSAEKDKKMSDVMDKVLNNEEVVKVFGSKTDMIEAITTNAPYVIDKLVNYKRGLESELKTIMGIDNKGDEKIEQLQMAEVNANNSEINGHDTDYENCLKTFCDNIKEVFGINVSVNVVQEPVVADGQYHDLEEKPGPKDGESDEN